LECAAAEAVREEQNRMRDALDYAARRGLHTCIGFEITGDPTVPEYRDAFLKRLEHVLDQYPRLDMVWLWQSETQGVQGFAQSYQQHQLPSKMDASSPLALYGAARRETFLRAVERTKGERPFLQENEAGKQARANEGARFEQFAQLALHVLAHRQNAPRLILSGWGGEDRLLSAEYYDGLDKLLPQDVIFSSLDFIAPRETVDSIYAELPAQRERWPIVWLECDGDQWHPQPWVHTLEKNVRNIREGGSQGILGIHWRTRDIEENFGYAMAYAWNPDLDPEGFFRDLAQRCYAKSVAEEMAAIHSELDLLGYRWLGGGGQNECAPFSWGQGDPAKRDALAALRGRVEQALTATKAAGSNQGRKRLQWLLAAMDWSLAYDAAQKAVLEASGLMAQARTAQDPAATKELAAKALTLLEGDSLAQALHAYARRVTTRGEYGVLATINTKAWVAWRDLLTECRKLAGAQDAPPPTDWQPEPQILLPRFLGSVRAQEELTLMPVVLGGQPAWAHYRAIGARRWISLPMETIRGWVKRVSIPAEAIQEPGIEIVFSFEQNLRKGIALGPIGVTVMPATPVDTAPRPRVAPTAETPALTLEAREGTLMPVELAWDAIPEADYYRVYRDDAVTVETAVPYFPDMPAAGAHAYRVEAIRGGAVLTASESVSITSAAQPVTPLTDLKAETNRAGVLLRWTRPWSPLSGVCTVERRAKDGTAESWEKIGETPASGFEGGYRDTPPAGEWVYRVTPMGAGGSGEPLTAAASFQPLPVPEPALDLPLTTQPEGADVQGAVEFGPEGARFSGGWITLPHQSWMDLGTGMTLDFEFRMDEKTDMPVLLCHGAWQADGWFVQILGNALIVRTPTADANGPVIELGKWYKARFVYDGLGLRLAIDGQDLPQPPATVLTTSRTRPLIIGNYEQTGSIYSFRALMRNIRIYPDVLTADEGR
ncbi:MAG: hypothetical protein QG656_1739, partial [Candidatus Hydrogenedentes bacterium]|nr:hypothetical protein [Candidatus Hydrogenedentota bacterium]